MNQAKRIIWANLDGMDVGHIMWIYPPNNHWHFNLLLSMAGQLTLVIAGDSKLSAASRICFQQPSSFRLPGECQKSTKSHRLSLFSSAYKARYQDSLLTAIFMQLLNFLWISKVLKKSQHDFSFRLSDTSFRPMNEFQSPLHIKASCLKASLSAVGWGLLWK